MISRFIKKIFGKGDSSPNAKARGKSAKRSAVIPKSKHGISKEQVSSCALKIVTELQSAGFSAFVVGGAVRDLLLGRKPKDFDVATNATPEQVRSHFRRSRIIGRRFQIVHVMFGAETVEVSTFRAHQPPGPSEDDDRQTDVHGRILRDNVFGSQEEDALRRDFTINALFFDPIKEEIWDYQEGVADLQKKRIRMIGDPVSRYREDPVRMLRAVRFAAKLGFEIDPATREPIKTHADLLENVPRARMFDEMLKLLLSGHAFESVRRLRDDGLHHGLLPLLDVILEQPLGEKFVMLALRNTDERIAADKTVSPSFLFATLLWHEVLAYAQRQEQNGVRPMPALAQAMDDVLDRQKDKLAIPRRYDATMKEIWLLQPRFLQRVGERPFRLLTQPRFRAAFDFFLLRADSGELDAALGEWWREFEAADDATRRQMLVPVDAAPKKRRRRRTRRGSSEDTAAITTPAAGDGSDSE
ncbi:MAG: polynucleotide adenylyltransferase PcnB [Pseudomonadota bacterium]